MVLAAGRAGGCVRSLGFGTLLLVDTVLVVGEILGAGRFCGLGKTLIVEEPVTSGMVDEDF